MADNLKNLNEAEFRRRVLLPLLKAMGYQDVEHYHGPNEQGKDVVGWKKTDDGAREYVAIVAKAGKINASASGDAGTVATQVKQAFGSIFTNSTTGTKHQAHRVIVAATGTIKELSREAVLIQINESQQRFVRFWGGEKVAELLGKYLPERSIPEELEAVRKKLNDLDHFTVVPKIHPNSISHRIEAKEDDATIAKWTFTFPDTPEGQKKMEAAKRFFEEGGVVTIPSTFIESFDYHEELTHFFGDEKPASVQLGPNVPSAPRPVYLEVKTDSAPLRYEGLALRLVKSGSHRSEFRTSEEDPLQITVVVKNLDSGEEHISTNLRFRLAGSSAHRARQAVRVWGAIFEDATFRLIEAESGKTLLSPRAMPMPDAPPAEELIQFLDNLAVIEERLGWNLTIPEHIEDRDLMDASELRQILENGSFIKPFETFSGALRPLDGIDVLETFPPGETRWFRIPRGTGAYKLLDRTLELGPVQIEFAAMLTEEERKRVETQIENEAETLDITFSAAPESEGVRYYYRKFLPEKQQHIFDSFQEGTDLT